jgi:cysteine-rich repeat protein
MVLYSVRVDGIAAPVELYRDPEYGSSFNGQYQISPDSTRVVYAADMVEDYEYQLYSVPIDGHTAPVKISGALSFESFQQSEIPVISPDSTRVVFAARDDPDAYYSIDLFSAPILGGSAPVKLTLESDAFHETVFVEVEISSDSTRAVYLAQETHEVPEFRYDEDLYSVRIDGSTDPVRLHPEGEDPVEWNASVGYFEISPDGSRVVFDTDALYSAPINGVDPRVVLRDGGASDFQITPDGTRVVMKTGELQSVPIDGSGPAVDLSREEEAYLEFQISPDSSRVVYTCMAGRLYEDEDICSAPIDGSSDPVRLTHATEKYEETFVFDVEISPDSTRVVYTAYMGWILVELFSVPIDGSGPSVNLSGDLVCSGRGGSGIGEGGSPTTPGDGFVITPDSSLVVYGNQFPTLYMRELYSVPIDGSSSPLKLNGALVTGTDIDAHGNVLGYQPYSDAPAVQVTSDGIRVVYLADQGTNEKYELWAASLSCGDGSLNSSEVCDDGDGIDGNDCSNTCTVATCGDGVLHDQGSGTETCDDRNTVPGDGCDASCQIESGYRCTRPGFPCMELAAPEYYVGYKVKSSLGPKYRLPRKDYAATVNDLEIDDSDADDPENFDVFKERTILLPAQKNVEPAPDLNGVHYVRYLMKSSKKSINPEVGGEIPKPAKHIPRVWDLENQFGTIKVKSKKVSDMLIPTWKDLEVDPLGLDEDTSHFICYKVKPTKDDTDQTPGGKLAKDLQAFFSDQFADCALNVEGAPSFGGTSVEGRCLLDLKTPKELCNPIDMTGVMLPRWTSAAIRDSISGATRSLLCYKAKLAPKFTRSETATLAGANAGDKIDPKQRKHVKREYDQFNEENSDELHITAGKKVPGLYSEFPEPAMIDTKVLERVCVPTDVLSVTPAP